MSGGSQNRWLVETGGTSGPEYAQRFRDLAASGADVHGEARMLDALVREVSGGVGRVLEAGCGTGRVALELARRGHDVTGVDVDASMLAQARDEAAAAGLVGVDLIEADLLELSARLGGRSAYDVVAAPGNVLVYLSPGTEADVVAAMAGAVRPGGLLVAGFAADRHVGVADYDGWCHAAGLSTVHLWSTWDCAPVAADSDYVVGVHRR